MVSKINTSTKTEKDMVIEKLLERKQPVIHSTFRLSQEGHKAIRTISKGLGIKNAEVFDKLLVVEEWATSRESISLTKNNEKIRKTYIVKKDTLSKLSTIANDKEVSRDVLVERIARAFEIIFVETVAERDKRYRKVLEQIIKPLFEVVDSKCGEVENELGHDDPVAIEFRSVAYTLYQAINNIEEHIENGTLSD